MPLTSALLTIPVAGEWTLIFPWSRKIPATTTLQASAVHQWQYYQILMSPADTGAFMLLCVALTLETSDRCYRDFPRAIGKTGDQDYSSNSWVNPLSLPLNQPSGLSLHA